MGFGQNFGWKWDLSSCEKYFGKKVLLLSPGQTATQVVASWTCVQTYVGWPNGLASTRKLSKNHLNATARETIQYLKEAAKPALTCVGWPNGEKTCVHLRANLISTKVNASHRKSTQVHASPGQTGTQVKASWKLESTCISVWPGLYWWFHSAYTVNTAQQISRVFKS